MSRGLYRNLAIFLLVQACLVLGSCTNLPTPMEPSPQHITLPETTPGVIPPLAEAAPLPPPPAPSKAAERYSIVVNNISAQEILFALARDAKLNIEIHPNITGTVTMNLIDQTLPEILDALSRQIDMRYELNGRTLAIMPDSPFLKTYQIDYPNVKRDAKNSVSTSTSVAVIGSGQGGGGSGSNASNSSIDNESNNHFWETLTENIKDLLRETDKTMPEGASEPVSQPVAQPQATPPQPAATATGPTADPARGGLSTLLAPFQNPGATAARGVTYREAAAVIANPETGVISVRATSRQHASIREFLDKVMVSARRQVLIEATIVEVTLSDQYQQGIDWAILQTAAGLSFTQITPAGAVPGTMGTLSYLNPGAQESRFNLNPTIRLLETFGKLHVLSTPKLSVLNNQTSLLKVVDESVYFTIEVTAGTLATLTTPGTPTTYTTKINTVPVGFMMYVTPQIGGDAEVTLNLRPTITRILGYATDPNPVLKQFDVENLIPQIQTREMESILRVRNGDIAVLGGLMQDTRVGDTNQIPGIGSISAIGELFKSRNDTNKKSELVIFLRPVILDLERRHEVLRQFENPATSAEWLRNTNTTHAKALP